MSDKEKLAAKLVRTVKRMEKLEAADKELREKLMVCMGDGESITVSGMSVSKDMVKKTVTDPTELMARGFDISRVTVTRTAIDPVLVKRIGAEENRQYYTVKPTIVCRKA